MDESEEGIESSIGGGSENTGRGSCCEAHDVTISPQEDRGVPESEMGTD